MNGRELFEYYTSKREYSGSDDDKYAQTLMTIFYHLSDNIFGLIEQAHKSGRKLEIKVREQDHPLMNDELTIDDIIIA